VVQNIKKIKFLNKKMKRAIFPGSFDPITLGHFDIIERGVTLFDELIIAIGVNADKKYMFSLEERKKFIEDCFKHEPKIKVVTYKGLTVHFCQENNVDFILRGLRNPADFEFEKAIAHTNRDLAPIETVFLLTAASTSYISSSIVRDVIRNDGDYTKLVPKSVRVK
jgi:pantetheine-phosphate adenylyltransferase